MREGADVLISGLFYHALVQAYLLCGYGTWVVTARILSTLEGVHVEFSRGIKKMRLRRNRRGG